MVSKLLLSPHALRQAERAGALNVLFISRRGSARSVLAASCLNTIGMGRFRGFACGSPRYLGDAAHPLAVEALDKAGMTISLPYLCQSWDRFLRVSRRMDFVITLAAEIERDVPAWPGGPATALWSFADPVAADDIPREMVRTLHSLRRRLELLVNLPLRGIHPADLRSDLRDMGYFG